MRGCLFLIGLLFFISTVHAQYDLMYMMNQEGKIIALPKLEHKEIKVPEMTYNSYTPSSVKTIEHVLQEFVPDYIPMSDERPMNMHVLSAAYQPFFNVYAPMLRAVSPMAFDFVEISVVPMNENVTFMTVGSQYTWPGMGGLTTINPMLSWNQDKLTITGGAFAGRYFTPFNHSPGFFGGVNLQLQYEVTDWMTAKTWGQYAFHQGYKQSLSGFKEKDNPHMLMNPFYPHTSVGGALEFKISDEVGIGIGVDYQYNPHSRKMQPQYLFYPAFRNKNIKIGIW